MTRWPNRYRMDWRWPEIRFLKEKGWTHKAIGERLGCCHSRVGQLIQEHEVMDEKDEMERVGWPGEEWNGEEELNGRWRYADGVGAFQIIEGRRVFAHGINRRELGERHAS